MQRRHDEIRQLGGEVIVISFAGPERVAEYQRVHQLPFPVLADPELAAYRALGLGRAGWRKLMGWRVAVRYVALMFRGWLPRRPAKDENPHQLGGDFVLDGDGRIVYAYHSRDPADRPGVQELIDALAAATT